MSGTEWTNLNVFAAGLHSVFDGIPYTDVKGLYALLDALENPIPVAMLDNIVPSAACWILDAGLSWKITTWDVLSKAMTTVKNVCPGVLRFYLVDQEGLTGKDVCFGRRDLRF